MNLPSMGNQMLDLTNINAMLGDQLASANKGMSDAMAMGLRQVNWVVNICKMLLLIRSFLDDRYGDIDGVYSAALIGITASLTSRKE